MWWLGHKVTKLKYHFFIYRLLTWFWQCFVTMRSCKQSLMIGNLHKYPISLEIHLDATSSLNRCIAKFQNVFYFQTETRFYIFGIEARYLFLAYKECTIRHLAIYAETNLVWRGIDKEISLLCKWYIASTRKAFSYLDSYQFIMFSL